MNITWTISQTEHLVANGFITTAHWRVIAVDGEFAVESYGSCVFSRTTPSTPYNQVTEQQVLNWCWANGVDKTTIENSLQTQINSKKTPTTSIGVPW